MKEQKNFPQVTSSIVLRDLQRLAVKVNNFYYATLKPALKKFGLLNEDSIRRFLCADDMGAVYNAAMQLDAERVRLLQELAQSCSIDFWKPFRADGCKVNSPSDEGFVFAEMPLASCLDWEREKLLCALEVKNGDISFSDRIIRQKSVVRIDDADQSLFDVVNQFCNKINNSAFKGAISELIYKDEHGKFRVNPKTILRIHHAGCF